MCEGDRFDKLIRRAFQTCDELAFKVSQTGREGSERGAWGEWDRRGERCRGEEQRVKTGRRRRVHFNKASNAPVRHFAF